jgi:hypothetical protein
MTPAATNPYGIAPLAVYQVQGIFAAIFFGLILLALPFLREPPPGYAPTTAQYKDEQSVRGFLVRALATKSDSVHATTRAYTFLEAVWTQEMALVAFVFFCCEITGLVRGPLRAPPRGGLDPPHDTPRPDAHPSPPPGLPLLRGGHGSKHVQAHGDGGRDHHLVPEPRKLRRARRVWLAVRQDRPQGALLGAAARAPRVVPCA